MSGTLSAVWSACMVPSMLYGPCVWYPQCCVARVSGTLSAVWFMCLVPSCSAVWPACLVPSVLCRPCVCCVVCVSGTFKFKSLVLQALCMDGLHSLLDCRCPACFSRIPLLTLYFTEELLPRFNVASFCLKLL